MPVVVVQPPSGGRVSWGTSSLASPGFVGVAAGGEVFLGGEWSEFASGHEASLLSYEACVGTLPFGCQLQGFSSDGIVHVIVAAEPSCTAWQYGLASCAGALQVMRRSS